MYLLVGGCMSCTTLLLDEERILARFRMVWGLSSCDLVVISSKK